MTRRDEAAKDLLLLGTASIDITPDRPIPLAGFAHRTSVFTSIESPLSAKIWVFERAGARALVVQADLIWWGSERMPDLYRTLEARWGFDTSSIVLHATHTHGGPQTSDRFVPSLGTLDAAYAEELEERLMEGIEKAIGRLEPVVPERGRGECRIGMYRRRIKDGDVTMGPNLDVPCDPEVVVIRFRSASGRTAGVWFHYACHPTTTGDNVVTSEFPGAAMERIEREVGAPASFLQGCCGDVRPALVRDGEFVRGSADDVTALGITLAEEVLRVLDRPMEELPPASLTSAKLSAALPLQPLPSVERLREASAEEGVLGEWARLLITRPERLQPAVPLHMNRVNLARGLSLLAFDAEMVAEYGAFVKSCSQGVVLPVPYSNGMIGYVTTGRQVKEGGYEPRDSAYYFGLPSPFEPEAEPVVREAIRRLLAKETKN